MEKILSQLEALPVAKRWSFAEEKKLCFNCFKQGHRGSECRSGKRYDKCNKKHHMLLHEDEDQTVSLIAQTVQAELTSVLLMTAVVEVKAKRRAHVRVFLNPGA